MKRIILLLVFTISFSTLAECPEGYIPVPPNKELGIEKEFCVMKYSAKAKNPISNQIDDTGCGDKTCRATNWSVPEKFSPVSVAKGMPWRMVDFETAKKACQSLGDGYGLINNAEWMTISNNIESVASNWSGNTLGIGFINGGHSDGSPAMPCDSLIENVDKSCSESGKNYSEKRTHTLSNGQVIWDISGNLWEWVDWEIKFKPGASPADLWIEINRVNPMVETGNKFERKMFESLKNYRYNSSHGFGKFWTGNSKKINAAIRGGRYSNEGNAGIYSLDLSHAKDLASPNLSFRCVKR